MRSAKIYLQKLISEINLEFRRGLDILDKISRLFTISVKIPVCGLSSGYLDSDWLIYNATLIRVNTNIKFGQRCMIVRLRTIAQFLFFQLQFYILLIIILYVYPLY